MSDYLEISALFTEQISAACSGSLSSGKSQIKVEFAENRRVGDARRADKAKIGFFLFLFLQITDVLDTFLFEQ